MASHGYEMNNNLNIEWHLFKNMYAVTSPSNNFAITNKIVEISLDLKTF